MSGLILAGLAAPNIQNALKTGQQTLSAIAEYAPKSLIEYGQAARVEPICVIDSSLTTYDFMIDICKAINANYTAIYSAAATLGQDVGRIKTIQYLDRFNPNRSISYNMANSILFRAGIQSSGMADLLSNDEVLDGSFTEIDVDPGILLDPTEDYEPEVEKQITYAAGINLPSLPMPHPEDDDSVVITTEAAVVDKQALANKVMKVAGNSNRNNGVTGSGGSGNSGGDNSRNDGQREKNYASFKSDPTDINTVASLSVGQLVKLEISNNGERKEIPITVRLVAMPTPPRTLTDILKWSDKDLRFFPRLRQFRTHELSFWRDCIFMGDVFKERSSALARDRTGVYKTLTSRSTKNSIASLLSLTPSVGTVSSIMVISQASLDEAEETLNGRLSDFSFRQRIMDQTGIMLIYVVDPQYETVTIYSYSIAQAAELSIKAVKLATKGNGPDINELMRLINAGSPMGF